jgi:hypothetical protein
MHPEILWELNAQRGREMRAQARQAQLARMAARSRRRARSRSGVADDFVLPVIPDYVDGSFRTEPVDTEPVETEPVDTEPVRTERVDQAASEAGQAPARHGA